MAWYRFVCDHGPGHQSHGEDFVELMDHREVQDVLIGWVNDNDWDWPIAKAVRVKRFKLADKVRLLEDLEMEAQYLRDSADEVDQRRVRLLARKD